MSMRRRTLLARAALAGLLALIGAGALSAQDRPDPVFASSTWRGQQVVAGELLVQFHPGIGPAQQASRHAELGCQRLGAVSAALARVALPAGADLDAFIERYQALPEVSFAQPNVLHRPVLAPAGTVPSDPKWSGQWNMVKVRAPEAWDTYTGDAGTIVAVIDSGVDAKHPDLDGHLAWGLDTYAGDADPTDTNGHGTFCAGVAAAETDNALGVAGASWAGRFAAYRCGNGTFPSSALVAAIDDAVARGAAVLSMSWGSSYSDPAIRTALQAARDAGCVLVAAAGNDGVSTKFYPAAHDFVIAVAASTSADARASFSNYGSWVDVAAPGQTISSTWKGGGYTTMNGTSMACPLVAGAASLLYARLGGARSPANALLVRAALENAAVDVGPWVVHGRIDMAAALAMLQPPLAPEITGLSPSGVQALHGAVLTASGSGMASVGAVSVDGAPAPAFAATDDHALAITMPDAPALGPGSLVLHGPGDTQDGATFTWVETAPPRLDIPASVTAGESVAWTFGGGVQQAWVLFIALDDATFAWNGWPILQHFVLLSSGTLDARGLGSLQLTVPASAAGITFHSQVATFQGGLAGVTGISTTAIVP
jgi:thermitase